jgi:hypothetical protein
MGAKIPVGSGVEGVAERRSPKIGLSLMSVLQWWHEELPAQAGPWIKRSGSGGGFLGCAAAAETGAASNGEKSGAGLNFLR